MTQIPVVSGAGAALAHAPGLVALGSKPRRELNRAGPDLLTRLRGSLRTYEDAVAYPPHHAYLGDIHPRSLPARPWTTQPISGGRSLLRNGEILPELGLVGLAACVDDVGLLTLSEGAAQAASAILSNHQFGEFLDLGRISTAVGDPETVGSRTGATRVHDPEGELLAALAPAHPEDDALSAGVLLENLICKATGVLAVLHLLRVRGLAPGAVDYVISCSEEAVGDRYQRGGGNMAKAVAEAAGLTNASGADIKNFCAAPLPALVVASSLVTSGVFEKVVVVGGGSLPKLGMKFEGHLKHGMPILEDVLASSAFLVEADDGRSPIVRLDSVGRHRVADGASNPQIMGSLAVEPLARNGLKLTDVDDFAAELHNPEITEPQGSGNVPERNYRTIAALAAQQAHIDRSEIGDFVLERGMPGYAPTQGHIASALCYMPHAIDRLTDGEAHRIQLLAKGSLFLGRMTEMSDGMSVVLERNPHRRTDEQFE